MSRTKSVLDAVINRWRSYKYRFVPWMILNVDKQYVKTDDSFLKEDEIISSLQNVFQTFHNHRCQMESRLNVLNEFDVHMHNRQILQRMFGFCITKSQSRLHRGGFGVVVSDGVIRKGHLASLYPGTVYRPSDTLFLQSIGNPFILRCSDGLYVDGNDRGISKYIYKSCVYRDRIGPFMVADLSWLTKWPQNPLSIGQYVNNLSREFESNVVYQEFDIPKDFPLHLRSYLPNIYNTSIDYTSLMPSISDNLPWMRIVGLLALRDIQKNEELFSSYHTIVN